MAWANAIKSKAKALVFNAAWRKGQKLRKALEQATGHIFQELVTASVDVLQAPDLAAATVEWAPLSDSWSERIGHEEFYFDTGDLERTLLGKDSQVERLLGRPQVFLETPSQKLKITSVKPPKKYKDLDVSKLMIRAVPFPRLDVSTWGEAEDLILGKFSDDWWKVMGHNRWMITPFFRWWLRVRTRRIMKVATA
jgi:hypothetical protein